MTTKAKTRQSAPPTNGATDTGRGQINDNFLAALVTSKAYRAQVVKARKGKGAYQRKDKHRGSTSGRESCLIAA